MAADLREHVRADSDAHRCRSKSRVGLEGLRRQDDTTAAPVVITRDPITDYLPIQSQARAGHPHRGVAIVTQYEMNGVGELGLLKMDFLGLRNLDVMEVTLEIIERSTGERVDIDAVALRRSQDLRSPSLRPTRSACSSSRRPMRSLIRSPGADELRRRRGARRALPPGPMGTNMHTDYAAGRTAARR